MLWSPRTNVLSKVNKNLWGSIKKSQSNALRQLQFHMLPFAPPRVSEKRCRTSPQRVSGGGGGEREQRVGKAERERERARKREKEREMGRERTAWMIAATAVPTSGSFPETPICNRGYEFLRGFGAIPGEFSQENGKSRPPFDPPRSELLMSRGWNWHPAALS